MEDKIDLRWRTSSYSGNGGGNCVEVAVGGRVMVRDSQDRAGTVLRFPSAAWRRFADQVKRSLALGPALRVSHCLPQRQLFPAIGAARTLVLRALPIRPVRTAVVFGEERWGFGGDVKPAVVSRGVRDSPSAFPI
jgi:hypothetical protein